MDENSLVIQPLMSKGKMKTGEVKWLLWGPIAHTGLNRMWDAGVLTSKVEVFLFNHMALLGLIMDDSSLRIPTVHNNIKLNL